MNHTLYIIIAIFILSSITVITRLLPFMFGNFLKNSIIIGIIGDYLPASIMLLLVLYESNIKNITRTPYDIPAFLGLIVVTLTHLWKRNIILSILVGTMSYILFTHVL